MDYDAVKKILTYDPVTGELRWLTGRMKGRVAGTKNSLGYIRIVIDKRAYQAHRLALLLLTGEWPTQDVDHLNGNRSDNRAENIKKASRKENARNRHYANKNNSAGLLGAHKLRPGKWVAQKRTDAGKRYLGVFDTPEEAAAAYAKA
jgi:hypothetical protein